MAGRHLASLSSHLLGGLRACGPSTPVVEHLAQAVCSLAHLEADLQRRGLRTGSLSSSGSARVGPATPTFTTAAQLPHLRGFRTSTPAAAKTYYELLGVPRGASEAEIKKAYYKMAKQYHPDTNSGDPTAAKKFQEAQRAYDTLRDPQKRGIYDQVGHAAYEHAEATGGTPGAGGGPFGGGQGAQVDPEDLFREFFGRGGGGFQAGGGGNFQGTIFEHIFSGMQRKGRSVHAGLTVSFDEAVKGTTRLIDPAALGIRRAGGAQPVEINIPPGVDSGFQLRVEGHGFPGPQGIPPGDLIVQISVLPSLRFRRDGFDLITDAAVSIADAALGTSVEVPTIDGRAEVKVKAGTQPGDKLRMRGYGVPMDLAGQRGRRGDQYVVVRVTVPKHLTPRQRELLEEFRGGKPAAAAAGSGSGSSGGGSSSGSSGSGSSGGSDSGSAEEKGSSSGSGSGEEEGGEKKKKKRSWFSFGGES
jgi:DnaJ-class molecular chaperone